MDSPRSEKVNTRYSTPVSDLNDHRMASSSRPINIPTMPNSETQLSLTVPPQQGNISPDAGPVARDFEQAILDDDHPIRAEPQPMSASPQSPMLARITSRRTYQQYEKRETSRSSSERSSSPPDSIDAFAEPRRRERANTIGSRHASEFEEVQRTVSGDTHKRRPTFDPHRVNASAVFIDDDPKSPEPANDECARIPRIDYEELEEFVAESRRGRTVEPPRKKYSFSTQGMRPSERFIQTPKLTRQSPSPARQPSNEKTSNDERATDGVGSEKTLALQLTKEPSERFTFFSTEIDKAVHASDFGGLLEDGERFRDMFELMGDEGAWWLDVTNPTKEELDVIEKAFGIHRLTTEDISEKETREKVELFQNYYFVCFRSYDSDPKSEDYLEPINMYLVVFREGILSFAYSPNPHAAGVRKRIGNRKDAESLTADWICYAMVDHIVDFYFPALRSIEIEADQIEDQVFVARLDDFSELLKQIGECRKRVMTLMRLLGGKADVIKGFAKRCNAQYSVTPRVEIGLYLSDIQDHVVTMMSNLGHFEKMLGRSHANYLAQLSVDNLVQNNRASEALGKITFIASVLVPMNLICGVFGMNIPVPGNNVPGNFALFGGVLGAMILLIVLAIFMGKRAKLW